MPSLSPSCAKAASASGRRPKKILLRVKHSDGQTRVQIAGNTTVRELRAEVEKKVPHRGRYVMLSLKQGDSEPTLCSTTPLADLALKRGQIIYARFYGDITPEEKAKMAAEAEKEKEARTKSFDVRGSDQRGFPIYSRKYVYKEKQVGKMCGQHALNALLQGPYEKEEMLEGVAKRLERAYRSNIGGESAPGYHDGKFHESPYRDGQGNYSIEVLKEVLKASHGLTLQSLAHPSQRALRSNPTGCDGFLLHKSAHWFAIRKVHGRYWVLNSTRKVPESLSDFHMHGIINSLEGQGYTTFAVCGGSLPAPRPTSSYAECWYDVERMLYDEKQPGAGDSRWLKIDRGGGERGPRAPAARRGGGGGGGRGGGSDSSKVAKLMQMGMGWSRARCQAALAQAGGQVDRAAMALLS